MRRTWKILVPTLALAAVALYFGVHAYTAKMPDAEGLSPVHTLKAEDLYTAFEEDEVKAGVLYNDKLIEVKGTVREVTTAADGRMSVLLESGAVFGTVVCEFTEPEDEPAEGTEVSIKGFCAGFNFDVLLQRCAFSAVPNKQPHLQGR